MVLVVLEVVLVVLVVLEVVLEVLVPCYEGLKFLLRSFIEAL